MIGIARKALDKGISAVLSIDPPCTEPVRRGLAELFEVTARIRGEPVFHPKGAVFAAVVRVDGRRSFGVPFLSQAGRYEAVVRLSKSAGTPGALPDPLGMAIRIGDAD